MRKCESSCSFLSVLAILSLLNFLMTFRISLSISVQNAAGILIGIVFNLLYILLDLICYYFDKDFCICVHKGCWFVVFLLSGFGIKIILDSE